MPGFGVVEGEYLIAWGWEMLEADATLPSMVNGRIYRDRPPQSVSNPYPCIVINGLTSPDTNTRGGTRVMSEPMFQVQVRGQDETYAPYRPIADRVDKVLQELGGSKDIGGGRRLVVDKLVRTEAVPLPMDIEQSRMYVTVAQIYRAFCHVMAN